MRASNRRALSSAFIVALAAGTVTVAAPSASATPAGDNVVINEVYGGGGNSGSAYSNDFVELYNPTDHDIDVTGWVLDQQSTTGKSGSTTTLNGAVPAGGYYLIKGKAGANSTGDLPNAEAENARMDFGAKGAIAVLTSPAGEVDRVAWGGATDANSETKPAGATDNTTSVQRKEDGKDTDDNSADFEIAAPTPKERRKSGDPKPQSEITPIAEIQGTGAESPLQGKTVTTEGVVTAVYDEGGKNGYFLQTGGTGTAKNPGDASDGIFVYLGKDPAPGDYPKRGESLQVTGKVSEFFSQTQITQASKTVLAQPLAAPKAVEIDTLPAGDEAREPYEGMLVRVKGPYTVTDNYQLNTTGDLGLAPGTQAHRNPTDVIKPDVDNVAAMNAKQQAEVVYLDDGRTRNYFRTDKNTPLPYLVTSDGGVKSIRTGDQVDFQTDVVVDYSFDHWRFQPLQPITGKNTADELPITWEDSRAASYDVPDQVKGDYSIGFFNVLNFFTSLGKDESGCKSYTDKNGTPVGTNNCTVRGAYSQEAFNDQKAKIVTAINKLDANVLGLSEIENDASVTGDVSKRDDSLKKLVDALNAAAGTNKWDYVKSPTQLGTDEDVIRVAFIYQPAKVKPVGESRIFDDSAFTGVARQPLAQEFDTVDRDDDDNFVAVVNHFKSKRAINSDPDGGDGQGGGANLRVAQAQALLDHLEKQDDWTGKPAFLIGDFNSYTMENSLSTIEGGGFTSVRSEKDFPQESYQYGGQLGTLDHVFANEAARGLVQDSAVWNINGDESAAFEYSRRNYNAQDFIDPLNISDSKLYGYGNPFRSSDHDPVKVGFSAKLDQTDAQKYDPQAGDEVTVDQGDALPDAKSAVKDADKLPAGTTFEWAAPENTDTVGDGQKGKVTVTYPDKSTDTVDVVVNVKPKARFIVKAAINDEGELVVTYDNGREENLGKVTGADGAQGPKGDKGDKGDAGKDGKDGAQGPKGDKGDAGKDGAQGPKGDKGDKGDAGKDGAQGPKGDKGDTGKDGRGVKAFEVNDEGHLVVTYTDDTTADLGKVTGDAVNGTGGKDGQRGEKGEQSKPGTDGTDGKDGRGIAEAAVNENGELVLTFTDGETQNLGRVAGADGRNGKDGEKGADGKDGKNGADGKDGANAPAADGSSVSDRCLPAAAILTLPLLALIPLGLASTMDIPELEPIKAQLNGIGAMVQSQIPAGVQVSPEMQQMAGGVAGTALAIAAIATLAAICDPNSGSSK